MFKSNLVNVNLSTYLNKIIFNNNDEFINFNLFNKKGVSLSGSFILELYNRLYPDITQININSNDMDIYIELNKINIYYLEELFMNLFIVGYRLANKTDKSTKISKQYNNIIFELYNLYRPKCCPDCELLKTHKYFSLSKYIHKIISLENIYTGQKLDIIFTKCTIRNLIKESFDFDIIKNFITKNTLYFYNKEAIDNRMATMTKKHFTNRVIDNIYELKNFILRYKKYTNRGFKIFIDENEIKITFIEKILKLLHILFNIDINTTNYITSQKYNNYKASIMIYSFYIKYFYLNEQIMESVYHPNNIHRLLNMNINLDDI
jgi:hypothetical protein